MREKGVQREIRNQQLVDGGTPPKAGLTKQNSGWEVRRPTTAHNHNPSTNTNGVQLADSPLLVQSPRAQAWGKPSRRADDHEPTSSPKSRELQLSNPLPVASPPPVATQSASNFVESNGNGVADKATSPKFDPAHDFLVKQLQVRLWLEDVLNEKILENIGNATADGKRYSRNDLFPPLRDGILLCRLMNALEKGSVPKINKSGEVERSAYMAMENIQFFLAAASNYGVGAEKLFAPLDLYSRANMVRVIACLWELAEISSSRSSSTSKSSPSDKEADAKATKFADDDLKLAAFDVDAYQKAANGRRKTIKEARSQSEMWRIASELEDELRRKETEIQKLRTELNSSEHHQGAASGCCVVQ